VGHRQTLENKQLFIFTYGVVLEAFDVRSWDQRVLWCNRPGSTRAGNTLKFIVDLRRLAVDRAVDPRVYALMVFDNALMQLGGLWLGSSVNKIRIPSDAAYLAGLTSKWLRRMAPEFFSLDSPTA